MNITQILQSFANDTQVHAAIVLIVADVVFGVLAAIKLHSFTLVRIADTLRDDVLGKIAPWLALFALGKVSNAEVAGIDFGTAADAAWIGASVAIGASILGSIRELGVNLPDTLAGSHKGDPPSS